MMLEVAEHQIDSARVSYIHCSGCHNQVAPIAGADNFGHKCEGQPDLAAELQFQIEFGLVHCEACGQGTFPDLGEKHTCPQA